MQYIVEFDNRHLDHILKVVQKDIATPRQMLGSLGEALLRENKNRHDAGLAPDGTKWKPNAKSTLGEFANNLSKSNYRKDGRLNTKGATKVANKKVLSASGDMLKSLDYQITGNDTLVLGFDGNRENKLASIHHSGADAYLIKPLTKKALKFGGGFAKKVEHPGLPARPLLGFPESDRQLVTHVLEDHLTAVLNRAKR